MFSGMEILKNHTHTDRTEGLFRVLDSLNTASGTAYYCTESSKELFQGSKILMKQFSMKHLWPKIKENMFSLISDMISEMSLLVSGDHPGAMKIFANILSKTVFELDPK